MASFFVVLLNILIIIQYYPILILISSFLSGCHNFTTVSIYKSFRDGEDGHGQRWYCDYWFSKRIYNQKYLWKIGRAWFFYKRQGKSSKMRHISFMSMARKRWRKQARKTASWFPMRRWKWDEEWSDLKKNEFYKERAEGV